MREPITIENMFKNEITSSILNLLINFQGLEFKYIRYALNPEQYEREKKIRDKDKKIKDLEAEGNLNKIKKFFDGKLEDLYISGFIKKGCMKNKDQLRYYLKVLRENGLNVIRKERNGKKAKYFIREESRNEGIRLENKKCIDFFPRDGIKSFPVECPKGTIRGRHVIYGLSDKIYSKLFNTDDWGVIRTNLEQIEKSLKNIYDIKIKRVHEERDRRLKDFMESTKSDKIKKFLQERGHLPFGMFFNGIALSEGDGVDILHSKTIFLYCFKYGIRFSGHIDEKTIEGMANVVDMKRWMDEMDEKRFCITWSNSFFRKDFGFSKSDIKEIVQWGWDNRDFFEMCIPIEIAYSRYNRYMDHPLVNYTVVETTTLLTRV